MTAPAVGCGDIVNVAVLLWEIAKEALPCALAKRPHPVAVRPTCRIERACVVRRAIGSTHRLVGDIDCAAPSCGIDVDRKLGRIAHHGGAGAARCPVAVGGTSGCRVASEASAAVCCADAANLVGRVA